MFTNEEKLMLARMFEVVVRFNYSSCDERSYDAFVSYLNDKFDEDLTTKEINNIAYYADNSYYDFNNDEETLNLFGEIPLSSVVKYLRLEFESEMLDENSIEGYLNKILYACEDIDELHPTKELCNKILN